MTGKLKRNKILLDEKDKLLDNGKGIKISPYMAWLNWQID